jgi:hypothetical protein
LLLTTKGKQELFPTSAFFRGVAAKESGSGGARLNAGMVAATVMIHGKSPWHSYDRKSPGLLQENHVKPTIAMK